MSYSSAILLLAMIVLPVIAFLPTRWVNEEPAIFRGKRRAAALAACLLFVLFSILYYLAAKAEHPVAHEFLTNFRTLEERPGDNAAPPSRPAPPPPPMPQR
jgi:peptidoglycan/LPS O-acetylase OafA/YrhL